MISALEKTITHEFFINTIFTVKQHAEKLDVLENINLLRSKTNILLTKTVRISLKIPIQNGLRKRPGQLFGSK